LEIRWQIQEKKRATFNGIFETIRRHQLNHDSVATTSRTRRDPVPWRKWKELLLGDCWLGKEPSGQK